MAVKHLRCRRWVGRLPPARRLGGARLLTSRLARTLATVIIQRPERLEHVGVIAERQRRMQSADDVQFGDAEL